MQLIVTARGSAVSLAGRTSCFPDAYRGVKNLMLSAAQYVSKGRWREIFRLPEG